MWLIRMSLIAVLLIMFYQDLRYRGISWYLFPVLAGLLFISNSSFDYSNWLINNFFILVVFVLLTVTFSIKEGRLINITDKYLGAGDLLFLICISFYFSSLNFFVFYLLSIGIIMLLYGVYMLLKKPGGFTIPLAGLLSLIFLCACLTGWVTHTDFNSSAVLEDYLLSGFILSTSPDEYEYRK